MFFDKQKAAYYMRISDWSSDVCSSDLADPAAMMERHPGRAARGVQQRVAERPVADRVAAVLHSSDGHSDGKECISPCSYHCSPLHYTKPLIDLSRQTSITPHINSSRLRLHYYHTSTLQRVSWRH